MAGYKTPAAAARQLLAEHWDGKLPVNPGVIAQRAGLRVEAKGGVLNPYPYSGYFRRDDMAIEYSQLEPAVRQRFTVAHELGHYALGHHDSPRDMPAAFGSATHDPMERAANQFAAELLMPADVVKTLVESGKMASIEALARAFGVSKIAMTYRLNNLSLT